MTASGNAIGVRSANEPLVHVRGPTDEIRVKGRKMIAWMGLCAVSVHMKFLRHAGEGESKTSRTPNLPGVETQREK
jgi:hypothetical protein